MVTNKPAAINNHNTSHLKQCRHTRTVKQTAKNNLPKQATLTFPHSHKVPMPAKTRTMPKFENAGNTRTMNSAREVATELSEGTTGRGPPKLQVVGVLRRGCCGRLG